MDIQNRFPQRLKQLRKGKKISRRTLSGLCGLSSGAVRRYESGEVAPSFDSAVAIADFFGVSMDYLAGRSDSVE